MAELQFTYGCMGSGKTTNMIKVYEQCKRKELKPIIIKPSIDDREGKMNGWGFTKSRLMPDNPVPAYYFTDLEKELPTLDFGILIIDEAQFLTTDEVKYICSIVDEKDINVFAFGLKTSVTGELFEGSSALLAVADSIKEIESYCENPNCSNYAKMHARFIDGKFDDSDNPIVIEKGNVVYQSLCRPCWFKYKKNSGR